MEVAKNRLRTHDCLGLNFAVSRMPVVEKEGLAMLALRRQANTRQYAGSVESGWERVILKQTLWIWLPESVVTIRSVPIYIIININQNSRNSATFIFCSTLIQHNLNPAYRILCKWWRFWGLTNRLDSLPLSNTRRVHLGVHWVIMQWLDLSLIDREEYSENHLVSVTRMIERDPRRHSHATATSVAQRDLPGRIKKQLPTVERWTTTTQRISVPIPLNRF